MGISARVFGKEHSLNAQEMNHILKEEGLLDGEPGAYGLTEKGAEYAQDRHHHRGKGGYDRYNAHWETRTWSEEAFAGIDLSDERKERVRQEVKDRQRAKREERDRISEEYYAAQEESAEPTENGNPNSDLAKLLGWTLIVIGMIAAPPLVDAAKKAKSKWDSREPSSKEKLVARRKRDAEERRKRKMEAKDTQAT